MADIALQLRQALERRKASGAPGRAAPQVRAEGRGWRVSDVICTSGPQDQPFEEQHTHYAIAIVLAGSFQYRSALGRVLMTPGSLMLGNPGLCFECGHEHGEGDRCISFWYAPDYFERLAADAGTTSRRPGFSVPRIPPLRPLSALVASAGVGLMPSSRVAWEELGLSLATRALTLAGDATREYRAPRNAEARVSRVVRMIDRHSEANLTLDDMARHAGLSPYHFLRTFERLTELSPHQYVRRTRLRQAAMRLAAEPGKIVDIALDCGFGDVSNFNRAFRTEFGVSPRAYRRLSPTPAAG